MLYLSSNTKRAQLARQETPHLVLFAFFFSLEKNEGACRTGIQIKKELKRNALGIALSLVFCSRVLKVNSMFWILIHMKQFCDEVKMKTFYSIL